jgi:hypothetical protein
VLKHQAPSTAVGLKHETTNTAVGLKHQTTNTAVSQQHETTNTAVGLKHQTPNSVVGLKHHFTSAPARYLGFVALHSCVVYPILVQWVWNDQGFLSARREDELLFGCGVIDVAG